MVDLARNEEPLDRVLRRLIVPMLASMLFMGAAAFINMLFVSALGSGPVAALSFMIPIMMLVGQGFVAYGIGVTSVVARAAGGRELPRAYAVAWHGLALGLVISGSFAATVYYGRDTVIELLGTTDSLRPAVSSFIAPWTPSVILYFITAWGTAALRGLGETRTTALVWMVQALANLVLDAALIFGAGPIPVMGLNGVALATTLSTCVSAALTFYLLLKQKVAIPSFGGEFSFVASCRQILTVAVPAMITYSLVPITTALFVRLLAVTGPAAVAGFGVAVRVEGLVVTIPLAIAGGLGPLVGQQWSGGGLATIRWATRWCRLRAAGFGVLVALGLAAVAHPLGTRMGGDPETSRTITAALMLVPIGFGSYGSMIVISSVFNNIGRAGRSAALSLIRTVLLALPIGWLARSAFGAYGVYAALPVASILAERVASFWLSKSGLTAAAVNDDIVNVVSSNVRSP